MLFRWLRRLFRGILREVHVYRFVMAHPRTPRFAKLMLLLAMSYMVVPIDLIPDFIPILGKLDDVLVARLLAGLALKFVPAEIVEEARARAFGS